MGNDGGGPGRNLQRALLICLVWAAAIAWSVYLVGAQVDLDSNGFAVAVQVMGSIGILFALFLVMRPVSGHELIAPPEGTTVGPERERPEPSSAAARWTIIFITIALTIGAAAYHLMHDSSRHQSTLFFIGVPAVLAITLSLTPKSTSATGVIFKGITLALLLSGIVFQEGFICIIMAAPLFYLVGALVGVPIDRVRRRKRSEGKVYSIVTVGLLLLSVDGIVPGTSAPMDETIEVTRTIHASASEVRAALASTPSFDRELPFYLRIGFPRPVDATGQGLEVGDGRTIFFGTESPMEPMGEPGHHSSHEPSSSEGGGTLELEIVKSAKGLVVFAPVRDETAYTHWLAWGRSTVRWEAIDAHTTQVTWTFNFRRLLSPSWYFRPWQRYAAEKAVGYLIDTVATP